MHQLIIFSFNPKLFFYSLLKVFEDVVEILDPEMNIDSETGEDIIPVRYKKKLNEIFYKPFIIFIIAIVPGSVWPWTTQYKNNYSSVFMTVM